MHALLARKVGRSWTLTGQLEGHDNFECTEEIQAAQRALGMCAAGKHYRYATENANLACWRRIVGKSQLTTRVAS